MDRLVSGEPAEAVLSRLRARPPGKDPLPPRPPAGNDLSSAGVARRAAMLAGLGIRVEALAAGGSVDGPALEGNLENLIGFVPIPVGVIGPLRINGIHAHGDFYVPLATTEGALVASYHRGAYLISQSGGAAAVCLTESVSRAPCFVFSSLAEAGTFVAWALDQYRAMPELVAAGSRHARLIDMRTSLIGKEVYLIFEFETGDASGQNMVTLATDAICRHLVEQSPVKPRRWYVEGNLSGDKKASMLAFLYARGKKVVAEATIRRDLVERILRATPDDLFRYWQISVLGGVQSGTIGAQGHFANALAAIFLACGQDVACVAEAATGLTRLDLAPDGDLYASVVLPNLILGTVGGGTHLPAARACLGMMDCAGEGRARKLAEICAATVLAGELSIIGAMAGGYFAQAHAQYGRRRA
jgi:hydroxymethylglutaryl-CoA reductase (NADPH)